jgi:hypothetical protein
LKTLIVNRSARGRIDVNVWKQLRCLARLFSIDTTRDRDVNLGDSF